MSSVRKPQVTEGEVEPLNPAVQAAEQSKRLTLISDDEAVNVFKTLIVYTLLLIFIPISTYVFVKTQVFENMLGMTRSDSFIYWAILSVASIHVVLAVMVFRAYKEGTKVLKRD